MLKKDSVSTMKKFLRISLFCLLTNFVHAGIIRINDTTGYDNQVYEPYLKKFNETYSIQNNITSKKNWNEILLENSSPLVNLLTNYKFSIDNKNFEEARTTRVSDTSFQWMPPVPKIRKVRAIKSRKTTTAVSSSDRKVIKLPKNRGPVKKPPTKIELRQAAQRAAGKKVKTLEQLTAEDSWETRIINKGGQNNCYYCVAAGLSGLDTDQMVRATEAMQNDGGTVEDTLSLLKSVGYSNARAFKFNDFDSMKNYLNEKVKPGTSKKLGLAYHWEPMVPNRITGHMVGFKVWKTEDGKIDGRVVDFQLEPDERFNQPPNLSDRPGPFTIIDMGEKPAPRKRHPGSGF